MGSAADTFFAEGCGRCPLGGTAACKVHRWADELAALRAVLLGAGLTETRKWGVACYVHEGRNVALLSALKDACTVGFLQGALLDDPAQLLQPPGPHSHAARVWRVTTLQQIETHRSAFSELLVAAMAARARGARVAKPDPQAQPSPEGWAEVLTRDPALRAAFANLTPGRQRGYLLHFGSAKQPATLIARVTKCRPRILSGLGLHDRDGSP